MQHPEAGGMAIAPIVYFDGLLAIRAREDSVDENS